jgi:hypothetical protein
MYGGVIHPIRIGGNENHQYLSMLGVEMVVRFSPRSQCYWPLIAHNDTLLRCLLEFRRQHCASASAPGHDIFTDVTIVQQLYCRDGGLIRDT